MTLPILSLIATLSLAADLPTPQPVAFHPRGDESITLQGRLRIPPGDGPFAAVVICHPDPRYGGSMDAPVPRALEAALSRAGYATLAFNLRGVGESTGKFDNGKGEVRDCLGALDFLHAQPASDPKRLCLAGYSYGSWVGLQACVQYGSPLPSGEGSGVGAPSPLPPSPEQPHREGEGGQGGEASSPLPSPLPPSPEQPHREGEGGKGGEAPSLRAAACLSFPVPADEDLTGHPYFSGTTFPTLFLTGDKDEISCLATIRALIAMHSQGERCTLTPIPGAGHFFADPEQLSAACKAIVAFLSRHCPPTVAEVAP
jgi:alpha/beta superfamily hydrolase